MPHLAFASLILISLSFYTMAEESTRIVLLQVPLKEADLIRLELNDTTEGASAETMDALLKSRGIKALVEFHENNPWRGDAIAMKYPIGAEVLNLTDPSLFFSVRIEGLQIEDHHFEEMLSTHIELPLTAKKYQSFENLGNLAHPRSGWWQERASWADDQQVMMMWQYSVVKRAPSVTEADEKLKEYFKVEMKWYRATKEDLKILESAKPGYRDKASLWGSKRAKLHKDGMFRQSSSASHPSLWGVSDEKIVGRGDDSAVEQEGFWVSIQFNQRDDLRSVEFEFKTTAPKSKGEDDLIQKKVSKITPGAWDFHVIEEMQGANVVIFRFSNKS